MTTQTYNELRSLVEFAKLIGVDKPNCHSCGKATREFDGDYGEVYSGTWCLYHESYLEDININLDAMHSCWFPDFWFTKFSKENLDSEQKMNDSYKELMKLWEDFNSKNKSTTA